MRSATKPNKNVITALIVLLGLTSPFSTDMCLPALPTIAADFHISYSIVNLIIITFFLVMALSTLISGPLSDRFGRKKIVIVSLAFFICGNALCAAAPNIFTLILARAICACGAGGMLSTSTALVKDVFTGRSRDMTLAFVQAFNILGPLCAPVIGALMLQLFNWHASFVVLAVIGIAEMFLALSQSETQPADEKEVTKVRDTFKALGTILHNRAFSVMLLCAGCVQACFMAYLATSSYIYTVEFGVPVQAYSVFFALSGCSSLIGPWFYMHILYDRFSQKNIYRACLIGILAGGLCIGLVGWLQYNGGLTSLGTLAPILFWLSFLLVAFNNSIGRPLATSMLLKQHDRDTGSLAALINFGLYIIGLIGMVIGSYDWPSYIIALGVIVLVLGFTALVLYSIVCRPSMNLRLEEDASSQPGQEA